MLVQTTAEDQQAVEASTPQRKLVRSVDHPDFKRLQALRNCSGSTEGQFLVYGGRQIKAALDAGYPLLEIWVPQQALRSLAWWQEMASSVHFDELFKALWYEAIGIALSRYQSSPTFVERDTELLQRLKRIRSKDGGLG